MCTCLSIVSLTDLMGARLLNSRPTRNAWFSFRCICLAWFRCATLTLFSSIRFVLGVSMLANRPMKAAPFVLPGLTSVRCVLRVRARAMLPAVISLLKYPRRLTARSVVSTFCFCYGGWCGVIGWVFGCV